MKRVPRPKKNDFQEDINSPSLSLDVKEKKRLKRSKKRAQGRRPRLLLSMVFRIVLKLYKGFGRLLADLVVEGVRLLRPWVWRLLKWMMAPRGLKIFFILVLGGGAYLVRWRVLWHAGLCEAGFFVKTIKLEGRYRALESNVNAVLAPLKGRCLWSIDGDSLRKDLERIPWVRSVSIRLFPPDGLVIHLVERRPAALWMGSRKKRGESVFLVDYEGRVIRGAKVDLNTILGAPLSLSADVGNPLVKARPFSYNHSKKTLTVQAKDLRSQNFQSQKRILSKTTLKKGKTGVFQDREREMLEIEGEGAPAALPKLLRLLARYPDIARQVQRAVYFKSKRWDLHFACDWHIMLPFDRPYDALRYVREIQQQEKPWIQKIKTIDMRVLENIFLTFWGEPEREKKKRG